MNGVTTRKTWTVAEELRAIEQFREGVPLRFIAKRMGRTFQGVKTRIVELRASRRHGEIPLRVPKHV